jgi:methyl-accepting chemotaxis protein
MAGFTFESSKLIEAAQHEKRHFPRAQNNLLVGILQGDTRQEGVSSDFSLTGLRLRLPRALDEGQPIELSLFLPHDDINHYAKQEPLRIKGRITWQRKEGDKFTYGVEFISPTESQLQMIKKCFAFFDKNSVF